MESLPYDVIEHILERLPGKSLLRFKSVSKKWKSTIESKYFQERQLIHRRDTEDVLLVHLIRNRNKNDDDVISGPNKLVLELESSPVTLTTVKIPIKNIVFSYVSQTSCDGLLCVFDPLVSNFLVNPTTRWSRSFPPSSFQKYFREFSTLAEVLNFGHNFPMLGFGKDNFTGTYKPVGLYNSCVLRLENVTTCEVFDFSNNAWRSVVPSSPHEIISDKEPLYLDGSLHWFTLGEETKVLSFDLHTETFQVISKAPFFGNAGDMVMCSFKNRLCVSEMKQLEQVQVIWSFDSGNKTWAELYSIDLNITSSWFGTQRWAFSTLPVPGTGNKNKLLLNNHGEDENKQRLILHDPETNSYDLLFTTESIGFLLSYFQSLISIP